MKTSIAALIAATLFLVGAYMGLGSGPAAPPRPPQLISIGGTASDAGGPTVADLPFVLPGTPDALAIGPSQILAVGRQVQQGSLKDLASSSSGTSGGPAQVAIGDPTTAGQQPGTQQININTTISPVFPAPGATAPQPGAGNPAPAPSTIPDPRPGRSPRPDPAPTPAPVVTPTPTPSPPPTPPVTVTVTPPVTATATPNSGVSPTP